MGANAGIAAKTFGEELMLAWTGRSTSAQASRSDLSMCAPPHLHEQLLCQAVVKPCGRRCVRNGVLVILDAGGWLLLFCCMGWVLTPGISEHGNLLRSGAFCRDLLVGATRACHMVQQMPCWK